MKFFTAALLLVAAEAKHHVSYKKHDSHHGHHDGHHGHHGHHAGHGHHGHGYAHAHTKLVTKLVPTVDYVKVAKTKLVDVEVSTTEEKEITKTVKEIEVYSNDSGDGMESGEYVPSISSISGTTHVHNSSSADSCSDYGHHGCKKSHGHGHHGKYYGHGYWVKKSYGHGHHSSSHSSSSDSDHSSHHGHHGKYYKGYGYGKKYHGHHGHHYSSHSSSHHSSSASEADHTHAHDGSDTYVHSHGSVTSVSSISADSSADEHVVEKQVTETITVPATKIVQKPVTTYETKAVHGVEKKLVKVAGPVHSHGYKSHYDGYKHGAYYTGLGYDALRKW